jgi:hypothetical protein
MSPHSRKAHKRREASHPTPAKGGTQDALKIKEARRGSCRGNGWTVTGRTSEEAIERGIEEYDVPERDRWRISVQREA